MSCNTCGNEVVTSVSAATAAPAGTGNFSAGVDNCPHCGRFKAANAHCENCGFTHYKPVAELFRIHVTDAANDLHTGLGTLDDEVRELAIEDAGAKTMQVDWDTAVGYPCFDEVFPTFVRVEDDHYIVTMYDDSNGCPHENNPETCADCGGFEDHLLQTQDRSPFWMTPKRGGIEWQPKPQFHPGFPPSEPVAMVNPPDNDIVTLRVESAREQVLDFMEKTGLTVAGDGIQTGIQDLMTNLLHLADAEGFSVPYILNRVQRWHELEVAGQAEDGQL